MGEQRIEKESIIFPINAPKEAPERRRRIDMAVAAALVLTGCSTPETFVVPGQEKLETKTQELTVTDREKTHQTSFSENGAKLLESLGASAVEQKIFQQESENTFVHLSVGGAHYLAPMINERVWFQDKEIRLHVNSPQRLLSEGYLTVSQWEQIVAEICTEGRVRFSLPTRNVDARSANIQSSFVPTIIEQNAETVGLARLMYDFIPVSDQRFIVANKGKEVEIDEGDIIAALTREEEGDPMSSEDRFSFLGGFIKAVALHEVAHHLANPEHSSIKNSIIYKFKPADTTVKISVGVPGEHGEFKKIGRSTYQPHSEVLSPAKDPTTQYYHSLSNIFNHPAFNKDSLSWSSISN
ncbi:MAG: hypothetical protein Q8P56_06775 [Candidatus Uhrbacteria bacterium]|nr:hypothetical protein [Candidatus Uhrbacteria bacterium]